MGGVDEGVDGMDLQQEGRSQSQDLLCATED